MITDTTSPAAFASTEANQAANPHFKALLSDYAMAMQGHQSGLVGVFEGGRAEQLPGANVFYTQQVTAGVKVENNITATGTLYDRVFYGRFLGNIIHDIEVGGARFTAVPEFA